MAEHNKRSEYPWRGIRAGSGGSEPPILYRDHLEGLWKPCCPQPSGPVGVRRGLGIRISNKVQDAVPAAGLGTALRTTADSVSFPGRPGFSPSPSGEAQASQPSLPSALPPPCPLPAPSLPSALLSPARLSRFHFIGSSLISCLESARLYLEDLPVIHCLIYTFGYK